MNTDTPKQFILLDEKPLLFHSISIFHQTDPQIQLIVVLPENYFDQWQQLREKYQMPPSPTLVAGGSTRFHSVKNGLEAIKNEGIVAIHDAARPLVTQALVERSYKQAEKEGNSIPLVPINSSIRKVTQEQSQPVKRQLYKKVQTPQTFQTNIIKKAYQQKYQEAFTDEATVAEYAGYKLHYTEGETANIKITYAADLKLARCIVKNS